MGFRSASTDNNLHDTHNSSYHTEPHGIISKFWQNKCELTFNVVYYRSFERKRRIFSSQTLKRFLPINLKQANGHTLGMAPLWMLLVYFMHSYFYFVFKKGRAGLAFKVSKYSSSETQGLFSPFFTFLRATFFRPFRLSVVPTICPWVSEDEYFDTLNARPARPFLKTK